MGIGFFGRLSVFTVSLSLYPAACLVFHGLPGSAVCSLALMRSNLQQPPRLQQRHTSTLKEQERAIPKESIDRS
jgi:hypothetical protein